MDNYTQHIGKQVSFDERSFTHSLHAWNKHLRPAIIALKQTYEGLNIGPFDQEAFDLILKHNGIKAIQEKYTETLDADITSLKLVTLALKNQLLQSVPDVIAELLSKKNAVNEAYQAAQNYDNGGPIHITWDSFRVIDGVPVIDEDKIRKEASKFIETPLQAQMYQKLIDIKDQYNDFLELFKSHGVGFGKSSYRPMAEYEGLFTISSDGELAIKPDAPFLIDRKLFWKQRQEANDREQAQEAQRHREDRQRQYDSVKVSLSGQPYENAPVFQRL